MRPLFVLAAAISLTAPAAAQPPQRNPFAADARLNQRITVQWKKATLYDALKEISRKTGVSLDPERPLVDEPLMASASNTPAWQVMDQIARLLHFSWARAGGTEAAPRYLLLQPHAAKQEEEDQINGGRRQVLEAIEAELDKQRRISRMSPEQIQRDLAKADQDLENAFAGGLASIASNTAAARKLQDGQLVRSVASPIGRAMLEFLDSLSPQQRRALHDERPLVFSSRPNADAGELPLSGATLEKLRGASPQFPFPKAIFKSFGPQAEAGIVKAEQMMQEGWGQAEGFRVTVHLIVNAGAQPVGMLRVAPEPIRPEMAGGAPIGALFGLSGLNVTAAPRAFAEPAEDPEEREKRLAADPVLGKKAVLKLPPPKPAVGMMAMFGNGYRVAEILPEVERTFGVKLIGDAYNRQAMSVVASPGAGEIPLYKILDQMAGTGREWERDGDVIRLRSRTWAHDRRGEIPARYMRRWLASREKSGGFSLEDMAEIVTLLRDEQVESLMFSAMEEGAQEFSDFTLIPANRNVLRLYGRLLPLQRQQLHAGRALPAQSLYPFQQALLAGLNRSQNQSMMTIAFGTKPERPLALLAQSTLTLTTQTGGAPPGAQQQPGTAPAPVGGPRPPQVYTFRIAYPNGQKDEYAIMMFPLAPKGSNPPGLPAGAPEPPGAPPTPEPPVEVPTPQKQ